MTLNPFEQFYDTPVQIGELTGGGSYSHPEKEFVLLDNVMADVQPYSGELAQKEYGLSVECQKRMYCSQNEHLKEGNIAVINGVQYTITYAPEWKMDAEVLLKRREYCANII